MAAALLLDVGAGVVHAAGPNPAPATGPAQDELPDWKVDPYTGNDPERVRAAGWLRLGTHGLPWGDGHGTRAIEDALGDVRLLWVETPHFRIGSSLPAIELDGDERERIAAELQRLSERLPRVKRKTKALDPWLRLHLAAQRLEELYADFCVRMGVDDGDFPPLEAAPDSDALPSDGPPLACLGMRDRFLVLLTGRASELSRYGERWGGTSREAPLRLYFPRNDNLFFGTSEEFLAEGLRSDSALAAMVAGNVVQDLAAGFRGFRHHPPRWWSEGLGHVYARAREERVPAFYSEVGDPGALALEEWDWGPKVRARVDNGIFPPASEVLAWRRADLWSLADNAMAWSRVDYLLAEHPDAVGDFMERLSAPIEVEPGTVPGEDDVLARQAAAFPAAFGLSPEAFDEAWSAWVLDTYDRRKRR